MRNTFLNSNNSNALDDIKADNSNSGMPLNSSGLPLNSNSGLPINSNFGLPLNSNSALPMRSTPIDSTPMDMQAMRSSQQESRRAS